MQHEADYKLPEMVDVAALHMWNQKYGPQVSFDCNTQTYSQEDTLKFVKD